MLLLLSPLSGPRPRIGPTPGQELTLAKRDLLSATDLNREEFENLLDLATRMKSRPSGQTLSGRTLGLLFFDRSLRTRVSFDVARTKLGGH